MIMAATVQTDGTRNMACCVLDRLSNQDQFDCALLVRTTTHYSVLVLSIESPPPRTYSAAFVWPVCPLGGSVGRCYRPFLNLNELVISVNATTDIGYLCACWWRNSMLFALATIDGD